VLQVHREPPKRDCPYVPTDEAVVAAMLRLAGVGEGDVVYDLGCGDGRICIAAGYLGARAVGVDIDPQRIHECQENARSAKLRGRVEFRCQSFFDVDLSAASVVTLYLLPSLNVKLRPKLLWELKPGSRVVCNYFEIRDWPADAVVHTHHRVLYKYIVPAWLAGHWQCVTAHADGRRQHMTLDLHRHIQFVTGHAILGDKRYPLADAKLTGNHFAFTLGLPTASNPTRFVAQYDGHSLRGHAYAAIPSPLNPPAAVFAGVRKE
jgi:SAM-dependent methyltransferase